MLPIQSATLLGLCCVVIELFCELALAIISYIRGAEVEAELVAACNVASDADFVESLGPEPADPEEVSAMLAYLEDEYNCQGFCVSTERACIPAMTEDVTYPYYLMGTLSIIYVVMLCFTPCLRYC